MVFLKKKKPPKNISPQNWSPFGQSRCLRNSSATVFPSCNNSTLNATDQFYLTFLKEKDGQNSRSVWGWGGTKYTQEMWQPQRIGDIQIPFNSRHDLYSSCWHFFIYACLNPEIFTGGCSTSTPAVVAIVGEWRNSGEYVFWWWHPAVNFSERLSWLLLCQVKTF